MFFRAAKLCERIVPKLSFHRGAAIHGSGGQLKPEARRSGGRVMDKTDTWMEVQVSDYVRGRALLAEMMGADSDNFTEDDVTDALRYLLPTQLSARDARPSLTHPAKIFHERKEAAFDDDGRPLDSGFYTGAPAVHNLFYRIYLYQKALGAVTREPISSPPTNWLGREEISNIIFEELSERQYKDLVKRLSNLGSHPATATNSAIQTMLVAFHDNKAGSRPTDSPTSLQSDGQVQTVGRRKCSTAVVRLYPGSGIITVNKRPFLDYFCRAEDRQQVLYPLLVAKALDDYDMCVVVHGGGMTGQAGAVRLAVSKALVSMGRDGLQDTGLLNRDPRSVERKKPGQKKARKKFAWVKR